MNDYNEHAPLFERPQVIELIRASARGQITPKQQQKLDKMLEPPPDPAEAFIVKTASGWLQTGTEHNEGGLLFGDFWYEGELCFLFADTNVGKSILAVQIGDSLSRGEPVPGFACPKKPATVLYFDFELSTQQFEKRYASSAHGCYAFAPGFYRVVLNPGATGARKFASYADYINNGLENVIISTGAQIVIIDNITCLRTGTDAAAGAVKLMRSLQTIKSRYGLSILVLAHTPKRNPAKPVTRNDLQGSKMLLNFADSAFAIGESQSKPGLRYLKQIKQRSVHEVYGAASVCQCRIVKPANFVQFEFKGCAAEAAHLQHYTEQQRKNTEAAVQRLRTQGLSVRSIATQTGLSLGTAARMVKRLKGDGEG